MKKIGKAVLDFGKRHKVLAGFVLTCIVLYLLASPFVAIHLPGSESYSCYSVVWDKWNMDRVDRIVVETPRTKTTITEKQLVKRVVKETMVADTLAIQAYYRGYYIHLYKGEQRIRTYSVDLCDPKQLLIYSPDSTHWMYESFDAMAYLPEDLFQEIEKAVNENGDSLWDPSLYRESPLFGVE